MTGRFFKNRCRRIMLFWFTTREAVFA